MHFWMNEKMMTLDILQALYSGFKKIRQFFFHTYSFKDTSVLLKVKIFEQVQVNTQVKYIS